jgi:hypothetical protein
MQLQFLWIFLQQQMVIPFIAFKGVLHDLLLIKNSDLAFEAFSVFFFSISNSLFFFE